MLKNCRKIIKYVSDFLLHIPDVALLICVLMIGEIYVIYLGVEWIKEGRITIPFILGGSYGDLDGTTGMGAILGGLSLIVSGFGVFLLFLAEILKRLKAKEGVLIIKRMSMTGVIMCVAGVIVLIFFL